MGRTRVAIVGIGGRGSWLVGAVARRSDVEIAALCDVFPKKAELAARKSGLTGVPIFDSFDRLLAQAPCDAVMVTTGDAHHAEAVVPALRAGKFVFCEKPLETTLARCQAIVAADTAAGGKTFVGHNLRYAPLYVKVKQMVAAGEVGDVLTIQADEFYDGGRTYFRRWNRLRSEGGGLWITKACHDFDLLCWLAGARPVEVSATAQRTYYVPKPDAARRCRDCALEATCPDRTSRVPADYRQVHEESGGEPHDLCLFNADSDTFDHGITTITFDRGILATYTCNVVWGFSDRRLRVSGTKGTIDGNLDGKTLTLYRRDPARREDIPITVDLRVGHGGADQDVQDSFFAFVRGEAQPKCRPTDAAAPVLVGLAATLAGDEHRVVRLDEFGL
jgi:predicted dehydrogenase